MSWSRLMFVAAAALLIASAGAAPVTVPAPGSSFRDCPDCPEMVVVPAGTFTMGAPADEPGFFVIEGPQRRVHVRQFAAGKFDVTRGQFKAFVAATGRATPGGCKWSPDEKGQPDASWKKLGFEQDDNHPVVCVTWNDAQDYARWLSQRTGRAYRLLTEAEWEYAARAGTATPYPWGAEADHEHANYGKDTCCGTGFASGRDRWVFTSPVGSFPPNAFGLYDMHGNVLQLVQDCLSASYDGLPIDGSANELNLKLKMPKPLADLDGTDSCAYRMARGGDWGDGPEIIRSASRNFAPPPPDTLQSYRSGGMGFRLATTTVGTALLQ